MGRRAKRKGLAAPPAPRRPELDERILAILPRWEAGAYLGDLERVLGVDRIAIRHAARRLLGDQLIDDEAYFACERLKLREGPA